ncbi:radical SAM protein [Streptomyces sp. NPDC001339]|uniref:radical SAM protein n=1 Tax=Streptomyces sp. NPDC001339 TaxID=3364563 RepID=UPI0036AC0EE5
MTHVPVEKTGEARLRASLSKWSLALRRAPESKRPDDPRYISYDRIRLQDGRVIGRKKVILMSGGCSVPTCTMCPFTNENNYGLQARPEALVDQVARVLARTPDEPDYEVLALYNDGSFFAPREIPRDVQVVIARRVAAAGVRMLVVESLPQFVTLKSLRPFVAALGDVELEVGIGLQSSDDLVRETLVNTRVSRAAFERAVVAMRQLGVRPKIYLMIKPPLLTEAEAITDVVESVDYVRALGIEGVTLCPTRVSRDTVAWQLWNAGHYQPPNLWTVVEAVRRAHEAAAVRVACINLRGTDFESVFPDSCPECADRIVDGLVRYSETGDLSDLPRSCACRPALEPVALDRPAIVDRSLELLAPLAPSQP